MRLCNLFMILRKYTALVLAAIVILAATPSLAQTVSGTLPGRQGFSVFDGVALGVTYDKLVLTFLAPIDGTFDLTLDGGMHDPTYVTPTVTVVDGNGETVTSTLHPSTELSPDYVTFDVLQDMEYSITLEFSSVQSYAYLSWYVTSPLPVETDIFTGGPGNDRFNGGRGDDSLVGNGGDDTLKGGKGNDILIGGPDNDYLDGGKGSDFLKGGAGDDTLVGGPKKDSLHGGRGDDTLKGGKGNDFLKGGNGGNDILTGGKGEDLFIFGPLSDGWYLGHDGGHKIITDFEEGDRIMLEDENVEWPSSVADIIASVVVVVREGTHHYVYTLAPSRTVETFVLPGLTLETDVLLRSEDFLLESEYSETRE